MRETVVCLVDTCPLVHERGKEGENLSMVQSRIKNQNGKTKEHVAHGIQCGAVALLYRSPSNRRAHELGKTPQCSNDWGRSETDSLSEQCLPP